MAYRPESTSPRRPPECPFCDPDPRAVARRSGSAQILLPRGPIVPGHLLVTTVHHEPAQMGAPGHVRQALDQSRNIAAAAIEAVFGSGTFWYEHGVRQRHLACSIHCGHAHANLIPDAFDAPRWRHLLDALARDGLIAREFDAGGFEAWLAGACDAEYYACARRDTHVGFTITGRPPRRVFRRALAGVLELGPRADAWHLAAAAPWEHPWAAPLTDRVRTIPEDEPNDPEGCHGLSVL